MDQALPAIGNAINSVIQNAGGDAVNAAKGLLDFKIPQNSPVHTKQNGAISTNPIVQNIVNSQLPAIKTLQKGGVKALSNEIASNVTGGKTQVMPMLGTGDIDEGLPTGTKLVNQGVKGNVNLEPETKPVTPQILDAKGNPVQSTQAQAQQAAQEYPKTTPLNENAEKVTPPNQRFAKPEVPEVASTTPNWWQRLAQNLNGISKYRVAEGYNRNRGAYAMQDRGVMANDIPGNSLKQVIDRAPQVLKQTWNDITTAAGKITKPISINNDVLPHIAGHLQDLIDAGITKKDGSAFTYDDAQKVLQQEAGKMAGADPNKNTTDATSLINLRKSSRDAASKARGMSGQTKEGLNADNFVKDAIARGYSDATAAVSPEIKALSQKYGSLARIADEAPDAMRNMGGAARLGIPKTGLKVPLGRIGASLMPGGGSFSPVSAAVAGAALALPAIPSLLKGGKQIENNVANSLGYEPQQTQQYDANGSTNNNDKINGPISQQSQNGQLNQATHNGQTISHSITNVNQLPASVDGLQKNGHGLATIPAPWTMQGVDGKALSVNGANYAKQRQSLVTQEQALAITDPIQAQKVQGEITNLDQKYSLTDPLATAWTKLDSTQTQINNALTLLPQAPPHIYQNMNILGISGRQIMDRDPNQITMQGYLSYIKNNVPNQYANMIDQATTSDGLKVVLNTINNEMMTEYLNGVKQYSGAQNAGAGATTSANPVTTNQTVPQTQPITASRPPAPWTPPDTSAITAVNAYKTP